MFCRALLLLAALSNLIEAGPVQRLGRTRGSDLSPRFVNDTIAASRTTSFAIPTTSSDETVSRSKDSALESSVPSRVATPGVGDTAGNKKDDSATEGPELHPSITATISQSASPTPASSSQGVKKGSDGTSATASVGNKDSIGLSSPSSNPNLGSSSSNIQSPSRSSPGSSLGASNAATASTSQTANEDGGAALKAFQQARGSQNAGVQSSPATTRSDGSASANPSAAATPSGLASTAFASHSFTIPRSSSISASALLSTPQTSGSAPSPAQTSQTSETPAVPVGGFRGDAEVLDDSKTTASGQNVASSSLPPSSILGQVPASILKAETKSSATTSASNVQQSVTIPSKEAFPNANVGASKMAQGYNSVFQGLDSSSKCDPNNKEEASACVRGQPAKCESDGRYTLISCDSGQTCYAVPKPNGESGVNIGCFTPQDYQAMISSTQSSAQSGKMSQGSAGSGTASLASSSTPVPSQQTAKAAPVVAGSGDSNAVNGAFGPVSISNVEAKTTAIAPLSSSSTLTATKSAASPAVASNPVPAFAAQDGTKGSKGTTQDIFPQPQASVSGAQTVATTSTSVASLTLIASPTPSQQRALNSPSSPVIGNSQQSQAKAGDSSNGHSSQSTPSSAPTVTGGNGKDSDRSQGSGSKDNSKDNSSSSSSSPKNNGIELSFPGSDSSKSKSNTGNDHSGNNNNTPQTNQKNAAPAADAVSSSIALPTSSSASPTGKAPAVTAAPPPPADGFKGYITVTVTETVTVHD